MIIKVHNLKVVSGDHASKIKFVVLESGVLLFGKCKWHKDLVETVREIDPALKVIGAGVVPKNISSVDLENEYWGNWESTGYKVTTPEAFRAFIRKSLLTFSDEINDLYTS